MPDEKIVLDDEAERFFRELGGIDTDERTRLISKTSEQMDESLNKEEAQLDVWFIMLVDMVHLIGSFLSDARLLEGTMSDNKTFGDLLSIFGKISKRPLHDGSVFIKYRGVPKESTHMGKTDFQVMFGDLVLDIDKVNSIIKRRGSEMAYLAGRSRQAFEVFSDHRINNLFIRFPDQEESDTENLFVCLQILSRYESARKNNTPIFLFRKGHREFCQLMFNEMNRSDLNLTLLAGLNGLKPEFVHSLVQKVDRLMDQTDQDAAAMPSANVYSMLFKFKNLREKIDQPTLEVNNLQWLMQQKGEQDVTREKIQVGRLVVDSFGDSPQKVSRVLDSVYGDDYKTVGSQDLGERLQLASELLETIDEKPKDVEIEKEVMDNIEMRLDVVNDDVFDDLLLDGVLLRVNIGGKEKAFSNKIHEKLAGLVKFFKARVRAKKKIKSMIAGPIDFDAQDIEALARDFNISVQAAKNLIRLLKECFDEEGRFKRAAFEQNIPEFAQYEKKVFEFLLHYLKETVSRNDRVAFLNSLQLLIAELQQPQKAIGILLDDFFAQSGDVSFSDRNAIMLSTLLLRKYNKELNLDIEITPEEVLMVRDGLSCENVSFASELISEKRDFFFDKIRTIHKQLFVALSGQDTGGDHMPVRYLFSLEREVYIFLALIGGSIAVSVIRSALKEYGDPDSDIYRLPESRKNISNLLQLLKVLIRGMGRNGISGDIPLIESIKAKHHEFLTFGKAPAFLDNVERLMEWIEKSKGQMRSRSEYE
jgi:hypothetical protein